MQLQETPQVGHLWLPKSTPMSQRAFRALRDPPPRSGQVNAEDLAPGTGCLFPTDAGVTSPALLTPRFSFRFIQTPASRPHHAGRFVFCTMACYTTLLLRYVSFPACLPRYVARPGPVAYSSSRVYERPSLKTAWRTEREKTKKNPKKRKFFKWLLGRILFLPLNR